MTSAFEETTFSFSDKAPPPPGERRQQARHLTILRVGALISEDDRELCLVRNISAGCLMAHVYSAYQSDQRIRSEEHTSELQSLLRISYSVFSLKHQNIS